MDEARLAQADKAYAAGDWRAAAREYLAAVHGSPPDASGRAYHMAGNALMKLRRYGDAATVYGHAIKDPYYDKRGSVLANLGAALAAEGRYSDAVAAFDAALEEASYQTPWKALQGKGGALYDMSSFDEACQAYREASWVEGNPDPGKALNNLGLCFMAMGRPEDAIEAYRGAIGLVSCSARGRASANLGLAYATMGFNDEAVRAFEAARDTFGHTLTGQSLAAYEAAKAKAGTVAETVEGWSTGEMPPVSDAESSSGQGMSQVPDMDEDDERFFSRTEDEIKAAGKAAQKAERKQRMGRKGLIVRVVAAVVVVLALVAGTGTAWMLGVGYPTHAGTVSDMMKAHQAGKDTSRYWVAVPQADVEREMRQLPARLESYEIGAIKAGPSQATVHVAVKLEGKADLEYDIWLVREGVGWRVNGIENKWGAASSDP